MIDSHQHFWTYNVNRDVWITEEMGRIRKNFYPNDSVELFAQNQIDGCIAVQADSSEEETFFLISLAETFSSFFFLLSLTASVKTQF